MTFTNWLEVVTTGGMLTTLEAVLSYKVLISVNVNVFVLGRAQADKNFIRAQVGGPGWVSEKEFIKCVPA